MTERIEERFRRLLLLVPYVVRRPEVTVDEVCGQFNITRGQLLADLDLLFMCGRPGYGPGDLIEAYVDGDHVSIRMAEYFERPLRLTPAEGLLLYSGAQALLAAGAADEALPRALKRLEAALGEEVVNRVAVGFEGATDLPAVRDALTRKRRIHIVYQSQSKEEVTERDVDPWGLFLSAGRWYLIGWCHRVKDERMFRVDRMRSVAVLDEAAEVPADVDLSKYEDLFVKSGDSIEVTLEIAPEHASWIREYYPLESQESLEGGWVRIVLHAGGFAWLERLLLRLGENARVVGPESVAKRVRELACSLKERYAAP